MAIINGKNVTFIPMGGIVNAESLPTANINKDAFYRVSGELYWYDTEWHKVADESDIQKAIEFDGEYNAETNKAATVETVIRKVAEIVANAPEDFKTLKALSDWLIAHEGTAAEMNSAIKQNAADIAEINEGLTDYVKNTDYATIGKAGLMYFKGTGAKILGDGELYINYVTENDFKSGSGNNLLRVSNANLAAKYGITKASADTKLTLTDEEKASAQKWLGVPTYGDVEELNITMDRTQDVVEGTTERLYFQTDKTPRLPDLFKATASCVSNSGTTTYKLSKYDLMYYSPEGCTMYVGTRKIIVAYVPGYTPATNIPALPRAGIYFSELNDGTSFVESLSCNITTRLDGNNITLYQHSVRISRNATNGYISATMGFISTDSTPIATLLDIFNSPICDVNGNFTPQVVTFRLSSSTEDARDVDRFQISAPSTTPRLLIKYVTAYTVPRTTELVMWDEDVMTISDTVTEV